MTSDAYTLAYSSPLAGDSYSPFVQRQQLLYPVLGVPFLRRFSLRSPGVAPENRLKRTHRLSSLKGVGYRANPTPSIPCVPSPLTLIFHPFSRNDPREPVAD